jgi:hypothetical protein
MGASEESEDQSMGRHFRDRASGNQRVRDQKVVPDTGKLEDQNDNDLLGGMWAGVATIAPVGNNVLDSS